MRRNPYQNLIAEILGTRPVAFNRDLARALGSAKAGLLLSQFLYWWDKGRKPGWIYKTIEEVESETTLTRQEQDTAIKKCKAKGVLKVELKGIPATRHFQLNIDKIVELVALQQPSLRKTSKLDCGKPANLIAGNQQTITENTPKSTDKEFSFQERRPSRVEDLSNIPEKDMRELTKRYGTTEEVIKGRAEDIKRKEEELRAEPSPFAKALAEKFKMLTSAPRTAAQEETAREERRLK